MSRSLANGLMLLTALIWGTTFVAQQLGMSSVGPVTYTGLRFLIGTLVVSPLAWREYRQLKAQGVSFERSDQWAWVALGMLLFLGAQLQQVGIKLTTVSNAGFLTALYVPLVPILGWLIHRHRPHVLVWPATLGSFYGTFLLSGGRFDGFTEGDWWVIASTLFWAAHVLWVGRVAAHKGAPFIVAWAQFLVCGVVGTAMAFATESVSWEGVITGVPTLLYAGVLSVGVAFTLQVVAQRHTHAADAAIIFSSEILFAAMAGILYLGERLTAMQMVGGGLIFACIVAVQLAPMLDRSVQRADA